MDDKTSMSLLHFIRLGLAVGVDIVQVRRAEDTSATGSPQALIGGKSVRATSIRERQWRG
jgi:hypothetical protein